jgi:hypothetical protein
VQPVTEAPTPEPSTVEDIEVSQLQRLLIYLAKRKFFLVEFTVVRSSKHTCGSPTPVLRALNPRTTNQKVVSKLVQRGGRGDTRSSGR